MKKILIVGKNAYLANNIKFDNSKYIVDMITRPFLNENCLKYSSYDYIVNFCIQPSFFSSYISEEKMIDLQIAKYIKKSNTKFIFLSSRKVYGSNSALNSYCENDKLKPYDYYSKNKVNIEYKLLEVLGKNLLILRTSNIVDLPPKRNSPTFISWLVSELKSNQKVIVTADKSAKKDFITKDYFQFALEKLIENNITGIYNLGAGFPVKIEDLMKMLVYPERLFFEPKEDNGEQFVLNCDKIHSIVRPFTEKELLEKCNKIKTYMERNFE